MEKPKLEDFGITQKDLDFCSRNEKEIEKFIGRLWLLTILLFLIIFICFINSYSPLQGIESTIVIFLGLFFIFVIFGSPLLFVFEALDNWLKVSDHGTSFFRKITLFINFRLNKNLKLTNEIKQIKKQYDIALAPFLAEEQLRIDQERLKEQMKKRQLENEKRAKVDYWLNMNGYLFEKEIELLFKKMGYKTNRTKGSGDGGVDIFVSKGGEKYIVQCKNHKKPVGPSIVRDLYGVLASEKADKAMLINSGGFTKGVHDFSKRNGIVLWDINDIVKWSAKYYQN